jgi:hypothetical protein
MVPARTFSMGEYIERKRRETQPKLAFRAETVEEWRAWKDELKTTIEGLLAPWPQTAPLEPVTIEAVEEEGLPGQAYRREKVVFTSEPGMAVVAWLLIPSDISKGERRPALLCCHGHGYAKDAIVGLDHGERVRRAQIAGYNYDYARQAALRGYVALAPDWRGFGERSLGYDFPGRDGCNVMFLKALLLGLNPLTLNVWDARRCLDYLETRPEVDASRIGCIGLSYGGTITLFTTALDERIRAAVVSCYICSLKYFALDMGHFCGSQHVPGILQYADLGEVAGLIAPRPLLVESGLKDEGFPIEGAREAFDTTHRVYRVAGALDRLEKDEFDGGHRWSGRIAWTWLDKWLKG